MHDERISHPGPTDHDPGDSPTGHRIMFVVLATLAFGMFAPTILLPILSEHSKLLAEEERLTQRIADLRREAARQEALLKAFASDLTINERLAVLDLKYQNPNEEVLPVLPKGFAAALPKPAGPPVRQSILLIPAHWPATIRAMDRWTNDQGLIDLFLDPTLRPAFLLMSGGLIIAAFVLFAPRPKPRARPPTARTALASQ